MPFAQQATTKVRLEDGTWVDGPPMIFTKDGICSVFEADGMRAIELNNGKTYYIAATMANILTFLNT